MAKYNWDIIENAYKKGIDIDTICKKYKVTKKTLQNRIYSKKLEVKEGNINEASEDFGQALSKFSGIAQEDKILEEIVADRVSTLLEDNALVTNNRKLAKMLQGVIVTNRESINLQNIRNISGTLKDIENIANPQASKTDVTVNTQNNIQVPISIDWE